MASAIAKIWRNRIEAGTQAYSDCPTKYQTDVLACIREDVVNHVLTAQEFKTLTNIDY